MPRTSKKKELPIPKKNEATNKKRKRTDEDGDKTSNKKIKIGWLRDIKAVLRSAGNRLVHIESESKLNRASKKKNKDKKRESGGSVNTEVRKEDEVGMTVIENSDELKMDKNAVGRMPLVDDDDESNIFTFNGNQKERPLDITRNLEIDNRRFKRNNTDGHEESCTFQQLQCKASGTFIRLENAPSTDDYTTSTNVGVDNMSNCNQSERRTGNEDCITFSDPENENESICVAKLIECLESDVAHKNENEDELDRDIPQQNLLEETNDVFSKPTVANVIGMKDSDGKCINGFKSHNYFFGTDSRIGNSYLDTGYTFAASQNEQRTLPNANVIGTNRVVDVDMNELEHAESQRSDDSDSNNNSTIGSTEYWVNRFRGSCSDQNGYSFNRSNDHQIPFTDNNIITTDRIDSVEQSQQNATFPITQAYYDSSSGAYVDPSTLQENKTQGSTNSFKNTWGSIKNLLSRVSGQKTSGDIQDNQAEEMINQAEEDLNL